MAEGENSQAPASAPVSGGGKKNNSTVLIIVIVVVAVVVLGVVGVFVRNYIARKAADKITSGILSSATGGKVSVDSGSGSVTVKDGNSTAEIGTATWPATMPSDVPKYTKGKITMSSSGLSGNNTGWSVIIAETNASDYATYKASLVSNGWTLTSSTSFGATVDSYDKGNYTLSLTWDPDSSGVSIGVTPKE